LLIDVSSRDDSEFEKFWKPLWVSAVRRLKFKCDWTSLEVITVPLQELDAKVTSSSFRGLGRHYEFV